MAAAYLTDGSQAVPSGFIWQNKGHGMVGRYLLFVLLEFGLVAWLVHRVQRQSAIFYGAVLMLLTLPLFRLGEANDLVMRASVPALLVLILGVAQALASGQGRPAIRGALLLVVGVGVWGAWQEPIRSLITPAWAPAQVALIDAVKVTNHGALPSNYVTPASTSRVLRWMNPPSNIEPTPMH
jgi:hypothetical protein